MARIIRTCLLILCLLFLLSCSNVTDEGPNSVELPDANQDQINPVEPDTDSGEHDIEPDDTELISNKINKQIKHMTLDEKVGQMMIVGFEGTTMSEQIKQWIEKYHVGGFIVFSKNMTDAVQTLQLINQLKAANANRIPLFLSVDQEGGRVSRLPQYTQIPASQAIGGMNSEAFSYKVGQIIGEQLGSFGLNMNYAPVLDIDSNPNNPVIGDRAYGSTPDDVSTHGIQAMHGMQSVQIIPVIKHFPGHGDTVVDSHEDTPIVNKSMEELRQFEWIPFAAAIDQHADAVMTAHILMTHIDKAYPASLSKVLITDVLRNELKFNGVAITDDMTMGAITNHYDIGEAAVLAVNAGNDMIMIAHGNDNAIAVVESIKQAVEEGIITEASIDEHIYRILHLKNKYNVTNDMKENFDLNIVNQKIDQINGEMIK